MVAWLAFFNRVGHSNRFFYGGYLSMLPTITQRLADELNVALGQVDATIALLDDGACVTFVARYRN